MDDKRPKIMVVNLLLVIFRCERLDENYNKINAPDKKFVFSPHVSCKKNKKLIQESFRKISTYIITKAILKKRQQQLYFI